MTKKQTAKKKEKALEKTRRDERITKALRDNLRRRKAAKKAMLPNDKN
ncbi:MAG: hypothetical protein V3U57_00805 [Robiginitomaculum sp.]